MAELKTISRVTVYADGGLEPVLLKQFLTMGSTGYTVTACRGKGEHDTIDDPFAAVIRVRIELLVQPEVAQKIVDYVDSTALRTYPIAISVETVQVLMTAHF